jgi:hypothetical protein
MPAPRRQGDGRGLGQADGGDWLEIAEVGVTPTPASNGPIATFECGGQQVALEPMTGEVVPIDKMTAVSLLAFRGFGSVTDTFEEPLEVRALE